MYVSEKIFGKKDLARLIFPLMIELALTLLVGMIDSVMVSSAGEEAVSGVSLIDTVFQLLIYIFAAFGTGGAVVAGQYLGAGKQEEARETSGQLVWFSGLVSLGITGLVYCLRKPILTVVFGAITICKNGSADRYFTIFPKWRRLDILLLRTDTMQISFLRLYSQKQTSLKSI